MRKYWNTYEIYSKLENGDLLKWNLEKLSKKHYENETIWLACKINPCHKGEQ